MVDINTQSSGLQSQLQAQLQGSKNARGSRNGLDLTPRPQDIIDERVQARAPERQSESNRQAPVQKSGRGTELSSARELEDAQSRVSQLSTNQREAPVGRLSTQATAQRNVPLGQIIDIRV